MHFGFQRQIRIPLVFWIVGIGLSCVSRTTTELRVAESLGFATHGASSIELKDPLHFSFAAVGDLHIGWGNTVRLARILASAQAEGDAFILFLGDIVDQGERSDVLAFQAALKSVGWDKKAFSVVGNHDIFYDGWAAYRELVGSSIYSFTAGNSKFVGIDTADGTLGDKQIRWLADQLASKPEHLFIFSHYLPVVPGIQTYLRLANETESLQLMSLASRKGVRAWLGAHYHSFAQETIGGVTYLCAGGGGGRRMDPLRAHFFVQVTVDGTNVHYQLRTVD